MVRKAGGRLSTKDMEAMGDLTVRKAIVCVASLPALLEQENEGKLMSYVGSSPWVLHLGEQCLVWAQHHFPET